MSLLSIANLRHAFGERVILNNVNLTLEPGEHVGMVGRNGCGKSTLMKLIAGLGNLKQDAGHIQLARGARAGYLSQDPDLDPTRTLRQEAGAAFEKLHALHAKLDKLTHEMEHAQGAKLENLLKKYEKTQHDMEAAGGYAVDHRIDATLHGLGIQDETFDVPCSGLSGGQKGRLGLAKLLLSDPDLLLLDEPTNHLDIEGRKWLEEYLASYRGAVIVISHDRWLLDRCVKKIYELDSGILEEYPGNYRKYRELRDERLAFRLREWEKQQEKVKREQSFIDRYRAGQRSKQAQGREKRLERFKRDELVERPKVFGPMNLQFSVNTRAGDQVISATDISKSYDDKTLFSDLDIDVRRGDRIGIIGPNGTGKTTLVNCLLSALQPDSGQSRIGSQVEVGYYKQTHEHLNNDETVTDYLQRITNIEQSARDLAGAFLFSGDDQDKPLGVMSGGERSRTVLAGLVAAGHNLLVLDEPTNHLDIPSAERLEEALIQYTQIPKGYGEKQAGGGTLLLITHDRMLLDNLVSQLLIFDGKGSVKLFYGNYSEYLAQQIARAKEEARPASPPTNKPKSKPKQDPKTANPKKSSKPNNKKSKLELLSHQKLEDEIEKTESAIARIDAELADPDAYSNPDRIRELQTQRQSLTDTLEPLEFEWSRRADEDD